MDRWMQNFIAFVKNRVWPFIAANAWAAGLGAAAWFLASFRWPTTESYLPFLIGAAVFGLAAQIIRR